MIVDCIADLHGHYPQLEGGDLLIVAGDLTARDTLEEYSKFNHWIWEQQYRNKIFIAGNHDNKLREYLNAGDFCANCELAYLEDSGTEFEGLKIWGSPWSSVFKGMNPHCKAFTGNDKDLAKKWELIPTDTDILITHSPPFTILDKTVEGRQVGAPSLMALHIGKLRPKLWVWGHIHEAYGQDGPYQWNSTKYVNASHMDENYIPCNPPIRVIL